MQRYGDDIYTEPSGVDVDTLKNLGPLRGMAGIFEGTRSLDINPKAAGPERQKFVERIFYGLRYHTRIVKPGEIETYHDQVGYGAVSSSRSKRGEEDRRADAQSTRQRLNVKELI